MVVERLRLVELHDYPQYTKACCDTLNLEWKRSETARMYSLQRSSAQLPVSLIMFDQSTSEFLGHARLNRMVERESACYIESVIIVPPRRGCGLGRELMRLVESYAFTRGFRIAYLTSTDKQEFYERVGYFRCPPPANLFMPDKLRINCDSDDSSPRNGVTEGNLKISMALSAPPPPPLPNVQTKQKTSQKEWMKKLLTRSTT